MLWKRKIKCGALSDDPFGPDCPAVAAYNALYICKSDTCAFKFFLGMEPLKYAKELVRISHVKPNSIVRDGADEFIFLIFASDLDFGLKTSACKLDCIGDEIDNHKS